MSSAKSNTSTTSCMSLCSSPSGTGSSNIGQSSSSQIVQINIGGQNFFTTQTTLAKCDLFNGIFKYQTKDIFIDRDPTAFQWCLNYLRGYTLSFKSGPLMEVHNQIQLLDDAKYYGIKSLERLVSDIIEPKLSYDELMDQLISLEESYQAEVLRLYKLHIPIVTNPEYQSFDHITAKTDLEKQIKIRQSSILKWKVERYTLSLRKFMISICAVIEYVFPNSPFTCNLGKTMDKRFCEDSGFKEDVTNALNYYFDARDKKPLSPYLKLIFNFTTMLFFQGLTSNANSTE